MPSIEVSIVNENGLHMRPAMNIVDTASKFKSNISINIDGNIADAKSMLEVMMLAAVHGTKLTIEAKGEDASQAIEELKELIGSGFQEQLKEL